MMKAIGAGTAAATIGSSTAAAEESESFWTSTDGTYDPYDPAAVALGVGYPVPWAASWLADTIFDEINEDPDSGDDVILHSQATSADERMNAHEIVVANYLTDMHTMANIEARHAIAAAWEDGKNASTAYADAITAIRSYYEPHEVNHMEILAQVLLDLGSVADAGTSNEQDTSVVDWVNEAASYTGSDSSVYARATANYTEDVEVTLHNGTTYTIGAVPHIRFYTAESHHTYEVPFTDVIDAYDVQNEEVTVSGPDYDWTASLKWSVPNVPDADLPAERVFDFSKWITQFTEFESQSDMVAGNYDEVFVEDIFAELAAGNIDPSDVRGVEGTARFLSGTEDATSDAYRMALMQQLDLKQTDLSKVASMKVDYTGFSSRMFNTTDTGREEVFGDYVTGETYEGQMFARDVGKDSVSTGEMYLADPALFATDGSGAKFLNPASGTERWHFNTGGNTKTITPSPDRKKVFVGINSTAENQVYALDAGDGSVIWSVSYSFNVDSIDVSPDGSKVFIGNSSHPDVICLSAETGGEEWSTTVNRYVNDLAVSHDGSTLYVAQYTDVHALNTSDGSTTWGGAATDFSTNSISVDGIAPAPDGSAVYVALDSQEARSLDPSDGSTVWTYSNTSHQVNNVAVSPDGSTIVIGESSSDVQGIDPNGNQIWSYGSAAGAIYGIGFYPDGSTVYVGSDSLHAIDPADGSQQWSNSSSGTCYALETRVHGEDYDGVIGNATMYDVPSSTEVPLALGKVTISEMSDSDGNSVETTSYDDPDYDTYDATEYATYTTKVNEYLESIGYWEDSSTSSSGGGGLFGGNFLENLFAGLSAGAIALVAIGLIALDKLNN
jgi:hypothetical protein